MAFQGDAFQNDAFQTDATAIELGLISQTASAFTPTISSVATVSLGLIDQTAVAYAPSSLGSQNVSVGLIDQTAAPSAPTITTGSVDVSLGLIDRTATASAPTVSSLATVALGLITQTASTFAPTVTTANTISAGLINQAAAASAPTVSSIATVSVGLIDRTAVAHAALVSLQGELYLDPINQTAVAFAPVVTRADYSTFVLADAPIAYWRLGEPSGVFVDSLVGNDGTATGTVTRNVGGIDANNAIFLAGLDYVSIPDSADMDFLTPFSIEAWIKHSGPTAIGFFGDAIWGKGTNPPLIWVSGTAAPPIGRVFLAKGNVTDVTGTTTTVTDGRWHHIVATYVHGVEAKIYIDGVDSGSTPNYGSGFAANATAAAIGSKSGSVADWGWHGAIDEVAIYDYALSPAQVLAHWQATTTSEPATPVYPDFINQTAVAFSPSIARPVTFIGSVESIRTATTNPFSFTGNSSPGNTGSGNSYQTGFVVSIVMTGTGGNMVTGVTFGGVPMTQIATAEDTTGEPGFASLWFCVPQARGGQTVTVTLTSATGNDFQFVAMSFASEYDLEVIDSDSVSGDTANPSVVLSTGGKNSIAVAALFSGQDAPSSIAELGTMTLVQDHDFGTTSAEVARQTTRGTTDFTAGFTVASEDVAFVALLLAEGINRTVNLFLISQTAVIFTPSFTFSQPVSLGLINQTAVIFTPEIVTLTVGLIDQTAVAFEPTISPQGVVVGLITQATTGYAPTITTGVTVIDLGLITQTAIARPPLVSLTTEVDGGGGPGGPGGGGATNHTRVFIEGLGNVAPVVIWSQTVVETAEGGEPSAGVIAIRDVGIDRAEFIPMARVTIDRGAGTDPIYSGYLIKPSRRFFFPVDYPDTLQRMWVLNVADINLLWSRRVTYNRSNPADIEGPQYVNDTYDDIALRELFDNWVDLSTDDLDVTTRIRRVGLINYEQPAYPFNGGQTLGEAVNTIAQLPAAVYGINSNRQVVYADVDDENAPFVLSDAPIPGWTPIGSPGKPNAGYREMTLLEDGTRLCNDVMAWGFGMGAPNGVFKRLKSQTSIDEHGLWQDAHVLYGVYKQATINKVADSVINGSPQSKRGQKNDNISVELVIFEDGLHVGDRVRFISHIWEYEDVIPVRKIEISFPTPYDVRYKFLLSHEIDRWGFQDPLPPFPLPGPYPLPEIPDIKIIEPPPVLPPSCVTATFMIDRFATFSRSDTGPFGQFDNHWEGSNDDWVAIYPPGGYPYASSTSTSSRNSGATAGTATVKVNNAEWGVRQPWTTSSLLNKDTVTGEFTFRLFGLPAGANWSQTFGPVTIEFDPDVDEIRIITGSGTTTETWTDWFTVASAATLTPSYTLEITLDLENDQVRVRLSHPSTVAVFEVTRAANGERVGVGDYQPEISFYWQNLTVSDFGFSLSAIRAIVYADTANPPLTGLFDFTSPDWVQYADSLAVPEVDPGITFGEDGSITLSDIDLWESGSIRREVSGGALNLGFGIYDYGSVNFLGSLLSIFFSLDGSGTSNRNTVNIGSSSSVSFGNSFVAGSGGSNSLFNSPFNPVNVKVEFNIHGLRLKLWAGGTAEPATWTAQAYGELLPWPNIFISVSGDNGFNEEGDHLRLGPLLLDTGEVPSYAIGGPIDWAFLSGASPTPHGSGRDRSWPFTNPDDPGGSGTYAVLFGNDSYTAVTNTLPSYSIGVVWPVFGPNPSNGLVYEIHQDLASLALPTITVEGVAIDYNVRVRGTVTGVLGEARYEGVGATGVPGRMNVIIERFGYGTGAAIVGLVPNPPYVDYNILDGEDKANFTFDAVSVDDTGQHHQSFDFSVLMAPIEVSGVKYLQWGVYYYGIDDPTIDSILQAGPLWGGGFLFTPNNAHYQAVVGNVTYELVPSALGYPVVQYNIDPCNPNPVGYDYGDPESGRICVNFTGNGTGDEFDLPNFVPGSADVIVDGYTLTPGVNYTEDEDHLGVTIPIPPPDGAWVLICVTVI